MGISGFPLEKTRFLNEAKDLNKILFKHPFQILLIFYFVLLIQFLKRGVKIFALIVSIEILLILLSSSNLVQIPH